MRERRPNTGVFRTEDEALESLIARIVAVCNPHQIWLFGDRAIGQGDSESDFELLVVTRDHDGRDRRSLEDAVADLRVDCTILVSRLDDFVDESLSLSGPIRDAVDEGRVIWHHRSGPRET